MESYSVRTKWGAREETPLDIAREVCEYLRALGAVDRRLQEWREKGSLRKFRRNELPIVPIEEATIATMLERNDRRHHDSERGLGYSLSLWVAGDKSSIGSIYIRAGSSQTRAAFTNEVRVDVKYPVNAALATSMERILRESIRVWDPDCVSIQSAAGDEPRKLPGDCTPVFDWMVYLRQDWAPQARSIPGIRSFGDDGYLLRVQDTPIDWSDVEQVRRVEEARAAVRRALPKRVTQHFAEYEGF